MIKGLALRPTMPDVGGVLRSLLGVLLVAVAGLHWGGTSAATAAAGTAAIAGATALQDSPRGRIVLVMGVSAVMGVAVLLASTFSSYGIVFTAIVVLWCFAAGMAWAVSANAGLIAAAGSALLVTLPPTGPTWSGTVTATALAVAGGLAQAALVAIWPRRRWRVQRDGLARAYRALAADARSLADDPTGHVDPEPLFWLREAFTLTDAQARRRPLAYRAWYGLPERISVTVTAIAGKSKGGDIGSRVLAAASDVLTAVAEPDRSQRQTAGYAMGRFDAVAATADGPEMALVQRFSEQLRDAVMLRFGEAAPEAADLGQLRRPRLPWRLRWMWAAVRGHLTWSSPVLRHAVRLASATAIGIGIARFADVPHGYWIPLTVVMVLRPETAHTYTRCVGRVAGNVVGIVVASAVILLLHPTGFTAVALAVVFLGVAYAVSGFGYLALSAALAAAIVFLIDVGGTAGATALGDRLLATLIGGALAVLAHVAVPDDAVVRLRQRAGELLKTETDYAATVIKAFVHRLDDPAEALSSAWERAFRARAAFEAAAGASWSQDRPFRRWLRSYRNALNAVTAACAALEASLPAQPPSALSQDFTVAVDSFVEALCGDPPTPGSPWRVDVARLAEAAQRVRTELSGSDDATARILVAEIGTITTQLGNISTDAERSSAPS
ncbi:MAG: hypothetical protein QOC69_7293 [Mycobacterium sp.]|nr:hypothetical protein [Mycobacterium sp.]